MAENPPAWAIREFCHRANINYDAVLATSGDNGVILRSAVRAGGAIIAEHEEPPVDPLLIEARRIAGENVPGVPECQYTNGFRDNEWSTQMVLAALRRGIELARETG